VIDVADFNDADKLGKGKEMVDRLSNLVSIFNNPALHFRGNRAGGAAASRAATYELESYWQVFPALHATLFKRTDRPGYTKLAVAVGDIKATIFGHAEFNAFKQSVTALFAKWKKANTPHLEGIAAGTHPKALIERFLKMGPCNLEGQKGCFCCQLHA
jgi:hypothetical protein